MSDAPAPWPLWSDEHALPPEAISAGETPTCPACRRPVPQTAAFCEACGSPLTRSPQPAARSPQAAAATPMPSPGPAADQPSAQTRRLGANRTTATVCPLCGGSVDTDGYCQTCGAKAPSQRDHFEQSPASWVAGVCDRGMVHHRNEDALALWADPEGGRAVLVVCDGVSASVDSDVAALAAAERARDVLAVARPQGLGVAVSRDAAMAAALVTACAEANRAVIAATAPESADAAAATFAAAVVDEDAVHYATLGDSRVYWIGDREARLLSVDDSMAQAFIDQGMDRDTAEAMPQAHAITRWLGRDSDEVTPRTGTLPVTGEGWLLVCSDGLWNYASSAEALASVVHEHGGRDAAPPALARALVAWANAQGGRDNVTVALARCGTRLEPVPTS